MRPAEMRVHVEHYMDVAWLATVERKEPSYDLRAATGCSESCAIRNAVRYWRDRKPEDSDEVRDRCECLGEMDGER